MRAAQRHGHPADHQGNGIAPGEDAPMGDRHPRTGINAKCAQAFPFVRGKHIPIDRNDFGALAGLKIIESHRRAVPEVVKLCNCLAIAAIIPVPCA